MPISKLENFIKNTDGRTIYVNPNDLNATDSINNQGTSITEPFVTIQRALLEAARFSYVRGDDNDRVERTTILLFPGEHYVDNRPGYGIKSINDVAVAVTPGGQEVDPFASFNLTSNSNFNVRGDTNVLHRFNSIYGGVIVPRGTSIVGLDLRKTKIRPLYVPNPTDPNVPKSAIFRITGSCYMWQFTIFDGDENSFVYTDPRDFSTNNQSKPTFSHHKLTAFEYADGVNVAAAAGFDLTDLQIYYSKLSNAYNDLSNRPIDEKYPVEPKGFASQRPEFEIVGAFATDPVPFDSVISGDGFTPSNVVTVDTAIDHGLSVDTPIKITGVSVNDYNVSTKVSSILGPRRFTYTLGFARPNLNARPDASAAQVTVETDTVTGASPYIFNVSMRSVWGVNGMHADGAKATGFRSMVVAQFTAVSLQKDDRAFVKYNKQSRRYDSINFTLSRGGELSQGSSSTNTARVYHLDPEAIYRPGWDSTHIKMSNDAVIQIVSVFAIGFNNHFAAIDGADASITNSNSNFGQFALYADGFKRDAFAKDDQGYITQIISPRAAFNPEKEVPERIELLAIDFPLTRSVGINNHLYLSGFDNRENLPPSVTQGFKIGANFNEVMNMTGLQGEILSAEVRMTDRTVGQSNNLGVGTNIGYKEYPVVAGPTNSILTLPTHGLVTGETIRVYSDIGDLPENLVSDQLYYAIVVDLQNIKIATSEANAFNGIFVEIYGGTNVRIRSRVNDKKSGDPGHPIQYDEVNNNWFIHTNPDSDIYNYIVDNPSIINSDILTYFNRTGDNRQLDEKLYRFRYVIPKEAVNAKPPTPGYVIQASASTGVRNEDDFTLTSLDITDYGYKRNEQFIVFARVVGQQIEVVTAKPHELHVGDTVLVRNITSNDNQSGTYNFGYNGKFIVQQVLNARTFRYATTDIDGFTRQPAAFTNNINNRNIRLPRFERKDNQINAYIYRVAEITPYLEGIRDGIYHLYVLNAGNAVTETFTERKYSQKIEDLYPQLDRDNLIDNPRSSTTFAKRAPLGDVTTSNPANSITRETVDKFIKANGGNIISAIQDGAVQVDGTYATTITFQREHNYNGVYSYATLSGGSGYTDGTYYNVKILSNFGTVWKGASATVVVSGGSIVSVDITDNGSGYQVGEIVRLDPTVIGSGTGGQLQLDASSIEINVDTCIQITGGSANFEDVYALITSVPNSTQITITRQLGAPAIQIGSYALNVDSATPVQSYSWSNPDKTSTFTSTGNVGFGINRGNSIVVFNNKRQPIGQFYARNLQTPNVLTAVTVNELFNVAYVAKAGLAANDAPTGDSGENIGVRGIQLYDNGTFFLEQLTGADQSNIVVRAKDGGTTAVWKKMYLGRYLQVGSEIMRVAEVSTDNVITVVRGAFGSDVAQYQANTKIRAIKPKAVEIRRPSVLRASGHTFEYLGYGPGNYSTALPQLQVRQLPEKEIFLVQSQETSAGQVQYTGMSDNGDFYIGNTKYSATSGTQATFDVPIPTVAGEAGGVFSVVFDEVFINKRLFVGGGEGKAVLSQFDGPTKFTNDVNIQANLSISGELSTDTFRVTNTDNAITFSAGGSALISGGAAIGLDVLIGGDLHGDGDSSTLYTDLIDNRPTTNPKIALFYPSAGFINFGEELNHLVYFPNPGAGTGTGGVDGINASSAPTNIEGTMVVKEKLIAGEFIGDGIHRPGSIILWAGTVESIPRNYLLCNGAYLSRTTYAKLFAAIGTVHGTTTSTNFRIPDLRDRFIVGAANAYPVTSTGGSTTATIGIAEMPNHTHIDGGAGTSHNHEAVLGNQNANHTHSTTTSLDSGTFHNHSISGGSDSMFHSHSGSTSGDGNHGHGVFDPGHAHNYQSTEGNNRVNADPDQVDARRWQVGRTTSYNGMGFGIGGGGFHDHGVSVFGASAPHSHPLDISTNGPSHNHAINLGTESDNHQHPLSITGVTQEHTHVIGYAGGSQSHNNLPEYFALCYIIQYQ